MDQQLINQKLESLRRCVTRIETRLPESAAALASDPDAQDIIALNLTRLVQICVDIAAHWIAEHGDVGAPRTMGHSFELLAEGGVIDNDLAINLRKSVGFRNIVVHSYQQVDWHIVFSICRHRLGDFKAFARAFLLP